VDSQKSSSFYEGWGLNAPVTPVLKSKLETYPDSVLNATHRVQERLAVVAGLFYELAIAEHEPVPREGGIAFRGAPPVAVVSDVVEAAIAEAATAGQRRNHTSQYVRF